MYVLVFLIKQVVRAGIHQGFDSLSLTSFKHVSYHFELLKHVSYYFEVDISNTKYLKVSE